MTAIGTELGSMKEDSLIFYRINLQDSMLESVYFSELRQYQKKLITMDLKTIQPIYNFRDTYRWTFS